MPGWRNAPGHTMGPMRREIERVLKQADRDLEHAGKNVAIQAHEVAAFLAEQAVDAANAVPYELYDEALAREKIGHAQAVIAWLGQKIASSRCSSETRCRSCAPTWRRYR